MRKAWLLAVLAAMAGCGNDPNRSDIFSLAGMFGETAQPQVAPEQLARTALPLIEGPVLLATIEATGASAILAPFGENAGVTTWTTVDRRTLSLRAGRIVATRGLNFDLMSSDATTPGRNGTLTHRTLNAANETVTRRFSCRAERAPGQVTLLSGESLSGQRIVERCSGETGTVTNTFWTDQVGRVRRSRQWIGPDAGPVSIELLRP